VEANQYRSPTCRSEMARRMGDPVWIERMHYVQSALAFPTD